MNKIMLLIIVLTTLSGCATRHIDNTVYPCLVYSETYDGKLVEYYKRKNGTHFMRFKLNSGMVKEMDMAK